MADHVDDALDGLMELVGGDDMGEVKPCFEDCSEQKRKRVEYNPRKPKWWSRLCGNPSRAQKRATNALFQTHRLPDIPFGSLLDWKSVFLPCKDIWMEVGFGRGENLLALAHRKKNEDIAFVGIEINRSGMGTACQRIQKGLECGLWWTDYSLYSPLLDPYNPCGIGTEDVTEVTNVRLFTPLVAPIDTKIVQPYRNVRLYPGDGVKLFSKIPTSSINRLLVTFPDPFPLAHEKEWRLVQVSTLKEIHRILRKDPKSQGKLFLATDHVGYYEWCRRVIEQVNSDIILFEKVEPCPDRLEWLPAVSHYERKGWDEGRQTLLSCWTVVSSNV